MTAEKITSQKSGWTLLPLIILGIIAAVAGFIYAGVTGTFELMPVCILLFIALLVCLAGFFTIEPNQAAVLLLFGKYQGTEKETGFRWANPFIRRHKISLRARNFDGDKLKVNDKKGNPIEISAVIVWRVRDTAQATFDVDDYDHYVHVQAESALRHLATSYAYDSSEDEPVSLRSSIEEVSQDLGKEIQERVAAAGVVVDEARINHLAYAPEIAQAMLQRQQAEALIEARTKIVDGAAGMVEMALSRLQQQGVVELDEERRANMVSNLMVVLCSNESTQPVINAGTLY